MISTRMPVDLVTPKDVVICLTDSGVLYRRDVSDYRVANRSGQGEIQSVPMDGSQPAQMLGANMRDHLFCFSVTGRAYRMMVHDVPLRNRRGEFCCPLSHVEKIAERQIACVVALGSIEKEYFVTLVTQHGVIKRIRVDDIANVRRSGKQIVALAEGDGLVAAGGGRGNFTIALVTKMGAIHRYSESTFPVTGSRAKHHMRLPLDSSDRIVAMVNAKAASQKLIVVTSRGRGHTLVLSTLAISRSGSHSVPIWLKLDGDEFVVGAHLVDDVDEENDENHLLLITESGRMLTQNPAYLPSDSNDTTPITLMPDQCEERVVVSGVTAPTASLRFPLSRIL